MKKVSELGITCIWSDWPPPHVNPLVDIEVCLIDTPMECYVYLDGLNHPLKKSIERGPWRRLDWAPQYEHEGYWKSSVLKRFKSLGFYDVIANIMADFMESPDAELKRLNNSKQVTKLTSTVVASTASTQRR